MKELGKARGARRISRRLGERLSYANVISTLALIVALGTGGAYAASKIGPNDIKKGAVRAKHVKKNQVKAKHVARNAVRTPKIRDGAVTAAKLADSASSFSADCNQGLAPDDEMVRAGSVCIDRYEASLWDAPVGGNQITGPIPCNANGQDCDNIYARSVGGVEPRIDITWFQAQQALANSGKRLPTNAEWQMAVAGTPDSTACNVSTGSVANTGANPGCVSRHGAFDMVGNLWEWVGDWDEQAAACENWPAGFGDDLTCIGRGSGEASTRFPGPLLRGGPFSNGTDAGAFAVSAGRRPSASDNSYGFRGAR